MLQSSGIEEAFGHFKEEVAKLHDVTFYHSRETVFANLSYVFTAMTVRGAPGMFHSALVIPVGRY